MVLRTPASSPRGGRSRPAGQGAALHDRRRLPALQRNVALRDLVVPTRAFPGDTLNVTGYLQADGYAGQSVDVELTRRRRRTRRGGAPLASERVALGADGEMVPVSFDLEPGEAGTFVYQLRVKAPADDGNPRDNNARRKSKSSIARRACCCLPAGRCATISISATSSFATPR